MAVKNRAALKAENATDFLDNAVELISPADLRGQMDDTADSALFPEDIPGLDVSAANVTSSLSVVTKTLGAWAEDIGPGTGGGGGADGASEFNTVAAMLASMDVAQGAGTVWRADGFRYREAASGATDHHLTTAGGVKLYVQQGDDGWYNFLAMGPARDGVTNDADKLKKLLAIRPLGPVAPGSDPWPLGPSIHIPAGVYFMNAGPWGFQIKAITRIRGEGYSPGSWGHATVMRFPVDCCGFVFNHYDTLDDYIEPEKPYGTGGTLGSIFERIHVEGVITATGGNPNAHGIWARTSISIRDVTVSKFNGNGINCVGTSTPGSYVVWVSGTDYAAGTYIQTDGGHKLYYCSLDPGAVPSTVEPTHTSGSVTGADGYRWLSIGDPKLRGGPSYMMLYAVSSIGNRNAGIYLDGGDSNAGGGMHCNAYANGRYGIFDSNFLGNTWIACHSRGNGLATDGGNPANESSTISLRNGLPTGPISIWATGTNYALNDNVLASNGNYYQCTTDPGAGPSNVEPSHAGDPVTGISSPLDSTPGADGYGWSRAGTWNKYYAKWGVTEASLVATRPGTNESIWVSSTQGGTNVPYFHPYYPVWQSGQPAGTYFYGSGYIGDNPNARNIFIGCYAEGDEPPGYLSPTSMAMGGIAGWQQNSGHIQVNSGVLTMPYGVGVIDDDINRVKIGGDPNSSATLFRALNYQSWMESLPWIWQYSHTTGDYALIYGGSSNAHFLTTVNTTQKMGTSKTQPYLMHFPTFAVGGSTTARRQTTGNNAPTSGEYAAGDIIWNANNVINSYAGWVCTTPGVAGTTAAWATGTNYAINAYVLATNGSTYRCSIDPGGTVLSTIEPSHASGEVIRTAAAKWSSADYALHDFILASNGKYYKCTVDPGAVVSTVEPTHASGQVIAPADGYGWTLVAGWGVGINYLLNDCVLTSSGKYYRCTGDPGTYFSVNEPSHDVGEVKGADGYVWLRISTLWLANTNYALNAFILASNGKYYRCSVDPGGTTLSTVEPSHGSGEVIGADTYGWTYVATQTDNYGWTFVASSASEFLPFGSTVDLFEHTTTGVLSLSTETHPRIIVHNCATPITTSGTVTLPVSAFKGASFRITRKTTGAGVLNVGTGPLKAMPADSWCEIAYTGSVWLLTAYGTL